MRPFPYASIAGLCISPIGLVPKKVLGKYRLIQHLSFPHGGSVNDAIPDSLCRVRYQLYDEVLSLVCLFGPDALMAKLDIESAFRLLPLHPDSFKFMGFCVDGLFYVDRCLPMGCAVSCSYFEKCSTFLHWCISEYTGQCGVAHYLVDFLFVGLGDAGRCLLTPLPFSACWGSRWCPIRLRVR